MNIRNISGNQILVWAALFIGLIAAILIGSAVGNSDVQFVAAILAGIPVAVIIVQLKTSIWVLLPLSWYLTGRLPWLPLPFSVRDICFLAVFIVFALFFATRAVPWKRKLNTLDYLIYINLAYLAIIFVRNPVGISVMQSSMVGGRSYLEIALAFGAFGILSRVQITEFTARMFPLFYVVPAWSVGILDIIGRFSPQAGDFLSSIYGGGASRGGVGAFEEEAKLGQTRIAGLLNAGTSTLLALCARFNALTLISPLYPLRFLIFATAFVAVFLSGFRNGLLFAVMIGLLASVLRGRIRDLWVAVGIGAIAFIALILLQGSVVQLPRTMQRALSWLPGNWDESVVADARNSTQWRFEMWAWAWNDNKIIRDKVLGQGFGFSLDEMNLIATMMTSGSQGQNLLGGSDREQFMITGTLHSGPLSTIKYIGVVGLLLYLPLLCYMAVVGWRLCKRSLGTPALPLALFVSIPVIYEPFQFIVVFGALEGSYPQTLFWAGLLNMVRNHISASENHGVLKCIQ